MMSDVNMLVGDQGPSASMDYGVLTRWINPMPGSTRFMVAGELLTNAKAGAGYVDLDVVVGVHDVSVDTWSYIYKANSNVPDADTHLTDIEQSVVLEEGDEIVVGLRQTGGDFIFAVLTDDLTITYYPVEGTTITIR